MENGLLSGLLGAGRKVIVKVRAEDDLAELFEVYDSPEYDGLIVEREGGEAYVLRHPAVTAMEDVLRELLVVCAAQNGALLPLRPIARRFVREALRAGNQLASHGDWAVMETEGAVRGNDPLRR